MSNLLVNSFDFNYDVIIFTETWLKDNVFNSEILCNKYQIYRYNRNNRNGGGVLIAVSCRFVSESISTCSSDNTEFICVMIKLKHNKIYLTCSYIPPNSDELVYQQHVNAIKTIAEFVEPEDSFFAFGDFNLPSISWTKLPDASNLIPTKSTKFDDDFLNNVFDVCLYQLNNIYNEFGKLLDLVFVNDPCNCVISRCDPVTLPEDKFHPTFEFIFSLPAVHKSFTQINNEKVYNFKQTNYVKLNNLILNTDWNDLLCIPYINNSTLDEMTSIFYNKIYYFMDKCTPKHCSYNHTGPPWNSKLLSKLKNLKNKHYKNFKRSGLLVDYSKYSVARAEYNNLNNSLYKSYLQKIKNDFKYNTKAFYNFVNSKRKTNGYPSVMKLNNYESSDDINISNMFADFFSSTYSDKQYCSDSYPNTLYTNRAISFSNIDAENLLESLKKLKISYNYGPDGVPSSIIHNCAQSLVYPLIILFNTSIKYGYFPRIWRSSFIIPLFKSGNRSEVSNYRGIAKLSVIPKIFEHFITDYMCHQLSSILSSSQHGFRKGCSTISNVLQLTTHVNQGFVQGKQTDAVYTDFSKAFDKVNHRLLLIKLDLLGFTSRSLNWIKSYLLDRTQCVKFNNKYSKNILVTSGVPQGSHLGPILFSLFINDLPNVLNFCNILMYADDVKIFLSFSKFLDHIYLQSDLNNFFLWCSINLMELNLKKCKLMRFSRSNYIPANYTLGDYRLEIVENFLDLGILLDNKLNFVSHITMMINKARGVLAFIKRWAKEFDDPYVTKQLYISLVRPILEYGSIIWDPYYNIHIQRIESVQKQFLLFCLRGLPWNPDINLPSYIDRLKLIKLPTLSSRRTMLNVTFMINIINGEVCSEFLVNNVTFNVPQRFSRHFKPLYVKHVSTNYAQADPLRRLFCEFNNLYEIIDFSLSTNVIKHKIISLLNN